MSYLYFDKQQLVNLEHSLTRELLRSNRAGSYASTTIIGANTRKYHGLLVAPQPMLDGGMHVLLSSLDETVIQHGKEFHLGIHKFKGDVYSPKGHKYVTELRSDPYPVLTFQVGGVTLTKEMLFVSSRNAIVIKYTLVTAHSPTILQLRPFLAFRNIHSLCKKNNDVETGFIPVENGIKMRMYQGYPYLYMQFSKKNEFNHRPDWYYDFEYIREKARGYDCHEDLFTPGYFQMPIKPGESIYFLAGVEETEISQLKKLYDAESKVRVPRDSFEHCLYNAAQQFVIKQQDKVEVVAGFHWFGKVARDTFISLPGLTLVQHDFKSFNAALKAMIAEMRGPLFPNSGIGDKIEYNAVDSPLWLFWTLQQYIKYSGDKTIWETYGAVLKNILTSYRQGTSYNIHMLDNGLLYAGVHGMTVTWMDATIDGTPVTPRTGLAVEVNALWYNAIMFAIELAKEAKENDFVAEWQLIADKLPEVFLHTFWIADKQYLADYVYSDFKEKAVRPNQIFAASLPYTMLKDEHIKGILDRVRSELLTPRGLRTLAPKNPAYKPEYVGNQVERDAAYHQGSVFPWLICHYAEAYLRLYEQSGLGSIERIYRGFEEVMSEHGIGTVSELYDGDPPHRPSGAISQAWSVSELIRLRDVLDNYKVPSVKKTVKKSIKK
jgi:predicted glycogen debranching enzyme